MAKATNDEVFRISLDQFTEESKKREKVPLTISADVALDGGITFGSTVIISGREGLGKSSMCLQYAANAQRLFGSKIFVFPIEGRLNHKTVQQIRGLDLSKVEIIYPPAVYNKKGERTGFQKLSAEKWWTIIGETMLANPKSVIIVDSIANFISEKELSEELGYQTRGLRQQLESDFARRYGNSVSTSECILFLITQIQANTGGAPGGPTTSMKVGSQLKFQADLILWGKWAEKWPEQNGKIYGHNMHYTIQKNAFGSPYGDITIPLRFGYGIDVIKDIVTLCIEFEIIKKSGAWFTLPFVEVDGKLVYKPVDEITEDDKPLKKQGEDNIRGFFAVNQIEFETIEKVIREKVFGT